MSVLLAKWFNCVMFSLSRWTFVIAGTAEEQKTGGVDAQVGRGDATNRPAALPDDPQGGGGPSEAGRAGHEHVSGVCVCLCVCSVCVCVLAKQRRAEKHECSCV